MLSDLFISITDAVFSYAIEKLDPAETIKTWLKRDPARLGFQKAMARAYTAFARQYPDYTISLFDKSFLEKEAAPELAKLLVRNQYPDPALLAQAWGKSLGLDLQHEFCLRATKPASDFLVWLDAELRAESAFQALFDSRALDSLPKIESEIEKLTAEIKRGFDEALKQANQYEKEIVKIGGSVTGSNIVVGDNNQVSISNIYHQYYSGDYARLNDYYIPPDGVFQRVRVEEFIGRAWLTTKVDDFLNDPEQKSGMFLLVGDAGVGKTSFMAHLVQERRYLHIFGEQIPGDANLPRALQSLGSQLVTRYQIDPYKDRDTLTQLAVFPDFLERLLRSAASKLSSGERIVILCDALDEVGTFPDGNVLGLPNVLPDGVYFILSQRPVNTKLPNLALRRENLETLGEGNLADMEAYLRMIAKRPEIAGQIRSRCYSEEKFIQTLKEKSLGVWMYLYYVIREIENGSRAPLDLENLPTGLVGYYADFWGDWRNGRKGRGEGPRKWDNLYAPLLTTLTAAQEPITVEQLIHWSGTNASSREVARLMREAWRAFITEQDTAKGKLFKPYHLSFRDFISGKVDFDKLSPAQGNLVADLAAQTVDAHKRIVNVFETECSGEWEKLVEQDYPRLHLSAHLDGAKEHDKLTHMLTEGELSITWAEARCQEDETYAGYLNDLSYVWKYAEQEKNYALAIRCMLIENSIHSLASNIPPKLLVELAKAGLWKYARCLSIIRQNSDVYDQEESLDLIVSDLPPSLILEALSTAHSIKASGVRDAAVASIIPFLNNPLEVLDEIEDVDAFGQALVNLAMHSPAENKRQIFSATSRILNAPFRHSITLTKMSAYVPGDLKNQALQESFESARHIYDPGNRLIALKFIIEKCEQSLQIQALQEALNTVNKFDKKEKQLSELANLAPYLPTATNVQILSESHKITDPGDQSLCLAQIALQLPEELKNQAINKAFTLARSVDFASSRSLDFALLAQYLPEKQKWQAIWEALASIQKIDDESSRADAVSTIFKFIPSEYKSQTAKRALTMARDIKSARYRVPALATLLPHLYGDLKKQVMHEALHDANKINDQESKVFALSAFAEYAPTDINVQAIDEALKVEDSLNRIYTLANLTPYISKELKFKVVQAIQETEYAHVYFKDLSKVILHIPNDLKDQVIQASLLNIRSIKDEHTKGNALGYFAPIIPDKLKRQALSIVQEIYKDNVLASTLTEITPHFANEFNNQLLPLAYKIKDDNKRIEALIVIIPYLSQPSKEKTINDVLVSLTGIKKVTFRIKALADLIPYLNEELKSRVLAKSIFDVHDIVNELVNDTLREKRNEEMLQKLRIDIETKNYSQERYETDSDRIAALGKISPFLNDELRLQIMEKVLSFVEKIKDDRNRSSELRFLCPYLPNELKMRAFDIAKTIYSNWSRVYGLSVVSSYLGGETKEYAIELCLHAAYQKEDYGDFPNPSALITAASFLDRDRKIAIFQDTIFACRFYHDLIDLFYDWDEINFAGFEDVLIRYIKFISGKKREDSFGVLSNLGPVLNRLKGKEMGPKLRKSITDVTRWWP